MADPVTINREDVLPVGSRISWGAVFAGAVIALTVHLLLTLLGTALGFTMREDVSLENLATIAAIWAIIATATGLFIGGVVTSQCVVGENRSEAVIHGLVMWAVVFAMMMWLAAAGVSAGFNAMVGMGSIGVAAADRATGGDWEAAARRAGVPADQLEVWKQKAAALPADAKQAAQDPQNREMAAEMAARGSWWALIAAVVSMATAILGGLVGCGPQVRVMLVRMSQPRPLAARPATIIRPS